MTNNGKRREPISLRGITDVIRLTCGSGETIWEIRELASRVCIEHYVAVEFVHNDELHRVHPQDLVACVKKVAVAAPGSRWSCVPAEEVG